MLYQYMSVDTFLKAFTPDGFWVKASRPCEFDDPYECTGRVTGEPTESLIQQFFQLRSKDVEVMECLKEIGVRHYPGLDSWEWNSRSDIVRSWLMKALQERSFLSQGYKISCFCGEGHDEDLMWAFYGDKSRGVRIAFDLTDMGIPLYDVEYLDEPPSIELSKLENIDTGLKPFFDRCVISKHKSWSLQDEKRTVFQSPDDPRVVYFGELEMHRWLIPLERIKSIDLGCKVMENFNIRGVIARKILECGNCFYLVHSVVRLYDKYGFSKKNEEIEMELSAGHLSRSIQIR